MYMAAQLHTHYLDVVRCGVAELRHAHPGQLPPPKLKQAPHKALQVVATAGGSTPQGGRRTIAVGAAKRHARPTAGGVHWDGKAQVDEVELHEVNVSSNHTRTPAYLGALCAQPRAKLGRLDVPVHPACLMEHAHASQHAVRIHGKVVAGEFVAQQVGQAVAVEQLQRHPAAWCWISVGGAE